ncbi:MAG TPA: GNAT family N-acetyltransferase [Stellaceae bacterium]|nr:GNAT family N-acetyltransferase [Stellaceae bacterium]
MTKDEPVALIWHRFADMPAPLLYEVLRFRQAVFVVEQKSAYEDLDGCDPAAAHLLARSEETLAGYLRLIAEADRVRIGRVCVAPEFRGHGLARRLMHAALAVARRDHPGRPVAVSAQTYLASFYAGLGFAAVSGEYDDAGVPHIDMVRPRP